ncbi:MAG: hypothetical protein SP1CHLAM54_09940 [Chlamydiia bacterium]|nr:hypothetical protein [Chlamydiia bacterium]MCH9615900.1 hypothetical protein [Chlamydiia bacterium]MCH9628697.1 hypothetical protein [Chlamydiia bacterium]
MRKFLSILTVLIVLLAGGFIVLEHFSATIVANLISETTNTPVSLGRIHFHRKGFTLHNLTIQSPPGYGLKRALYVKKIHVEAPYLNYLKKPIMIDRIKCQDIYLGIEFRNAARTEGNWLTLLEDSKEDSPSLSGRQNSSIIGTLLLENINVELALYQQPTRRVPPIPALVFHNVRTDDGKIVEKLTQAIMHQLMRELFLQKSMKALIDLPGGVFKTIFPF